MPPDAKPKAPTRAELIDELGDLNPALLNRRVERVTAIKKEMQSWMDGKRPTQAASFAGARYSIVIEARKNERTISAMDKVFDFFGRRKFLALCSLALKVFDEEKVPKETCAAWITEARTGSRPITIARKAA